MNTRWFVVAALATAFFAVFAAPALSQEGLFPERGHGALVMQGPDGNLQLEETGGRWWVTAPDGRRMLGDRRGIEQMIERLATIRTERPVGRHGRARDGAFDHPVQLSWGGRQVILGGASRIPGLNYVKLSSGALHLVKPTNIHVSTDGLVDRRLFPDGLQEVVEVDVSGPDGAMHASRKVGPWRLTAPLPSGADGRGIDAWIGRIAQLKGDPSETRANPAESYEVVMTHVDGSTTGFSATPDGRITQGGMTIVTDPVGGELVPSRFSWLPKEVVRVQEGEITGIQVQTRERTRVFTRRDRNAWEEKGTGTVYRSWVKGLFQELAPLTATGLYLGDREALGLAHVEVRLWRDKSLLTSIEVWREGDQWLARGGDGVLVYAIGESFPVHLSRVF